MTDKQLELPSMVRTVPNYLVVWHDKAINKDRTHGLWLRPGARDCYGMDRLRGEGAHTSLEFGFSTWAIPFVWLRSFERRGSEKLMHSDSIHLIKTVWPPLLPWYDAYHRFLHLLSMISMYDWYLYWVYWIDGPDIVLISISLRHREKREQRTVLSSAELSFYAFNIETYKRDQTFIDWRSSKKNRLSISYLKEFFWIY